MVNVLLSLRIKSNKTLSYIKKEFKILIQEYKLKESDIKSINISRNLDNTINFFIKTNTIKNASKIKNIIKQIYEIEYFNIITGKVAD